MSDFQRRNKTWVLLTDVDEYITFNTYHDHSDPPVPLDFGPPGVPTLCNWTWAVTGYKKGGMQVDETTVKGILTGLPPQGWHGKMNGDPKRTLPLINGKDEIFYGAYGSIFTDNAGNRWFLRDDFAWRDAIEMPLDQVPEDVPVINNATVVGNVLRGTIDGEPVEIRTNWRDPAELRSRALLLPSTNFERKTMHGGHMVKDVDGRQYFAERDTILWPPHLSSRQLLEIRKRLPTVADAKTILDVIYREMQALGPEYAHETVGPCLCMPRLLYGAKEEEGGAAWEGMAPEGFDDSDFVTLRYRWHSLPDNRVNKYQKTMIDISRIPRERLKGEAEK